MGRIGVVVANEPLAYREAIAAAVRVLRPQVEVTVLTPDALDDVLVCRRAHVVICSLLTEVVRHEATYWVVLSPHTQIGAHLGHAGQEVARDSMQLDDLLAIIDEAGRYRPHPDWANPDTSAAV